MTSNLLNRLVPTKLLVLAVVGLGVSVANADDSMPQVPAVSGQRGRIAQKKLLEYQSMFSGPGCIYLKNQYQDALERLKVELTKITEAQDRVALQTYFEKEVMPRIARQEKEVPGMGTNDELEARRKASMDWLAANVPDPSKATDATGIQTYVAKRKAYLARAAIDHAFVEKLLATSTCHKFYFQGFTAWEAQTREKDLLAKLDPALDAVLPQLNVSNGKGGYHHFKAGDLKPGVGRRGDVLYDTVSIRAEIAKLAPAIALTRQWAAALEGPKAAQLNARVDELEAQVKDMEKVYGELLPSIAVPAGAKPSGAAAAAVKKVGPTLTARITGPLARTQKTVTEDVTIGGRTKRMTFPVDYDSVEFSTVRKGPPYEWWTDMPAAKLGELCTVSHYSGTYYRKGMNVKLNEWIFSSEIDAPMLCKNKDATYKE